MVMPTWLLSPTFDFLRLKLVPVDMWLLGLDIFLLTWGADVFTPCWPLIAVPNFCVVDWNYFYVDAPVWLWFWLPTFKPGETPVWSSIFMCIGCFAFAWDYMAFCESPPYIVLYIIPPDLFDVIWDRPNGLPPALCCWTLSCCWFPFSNVWFAIMFPPIIPRALEFLLCLYCYC